MDRIDSVSNERIKRVVALKDRAERRRAGLFVLEGYNNIKDCPLEAQELYVEDGFDKKLPQAKAVFAVSGKVAAKLSSTVNTQGIFGVYVMPDLAVKVPKGDKALILDGITDSGNLGTIIRTAAATGFNDIYLHDCTDVFAPKVVRSAVSAIFKVRLMEGTADGIIDAVKEGGLTPVALDMGGENIFAAQLIEPAFIVGSEAHGICSELRAKSTKTVSLPMQNMESLNAAVAAGIVMYIHTHGQALR